MLEYIRTDRCRMRFLRELLDDAEAVDCGRCDNCTGEHQSIATDETALEAARLHIYRPGSDSQPPSAVADRNEAARRRCRRQDHRG